MPTDSAARNSMPSGGSIFTEQSRSYSSVTTAARSSDSNRPGQRRRYNFRSRAVTDATRNKSSRLLTPTADHGVVIDTAIYHYTTQDLVQAIKLVVPPAQVHSFGRMQGCFHIYFLDRSWSLQLRATGLDMPDNLHVTCQPVGAPPTRVVVSDVPSHFDNVYLREIMSDFGQVVGPIRTLRAAYTDPDLPTVLSFRRQVNLKFPTTQARDSLPERVFVDYDDVPLTFFLSIDVKCHLCHATGHLRSRCPQLPRENPPQEDSASDPTRSSNPATDVISDMDLSPIQAVLDPALSHLSSALPEDAVATCSSNLPSGFPILPPPTRPTAKRTSTSVADSPALKKPLPHTSSECSDPPSQHSDIADPALDDLLATANPTAVALSDSDLAALFDRMHRSPLSPLVHIRQFTDDVPAFLHQLSSLRKDSVAHKSSPLSHLSKGALYQCIRKISKAYSDEQPPAST